MDSTEAFSTAEDILKHLRTRKVEGFSLTDLTTFNDAITRRLHEFSDAQRAEIRKLFQAFADKFQPVT